MTEHNAYKTIKCSLQQILRDDNEKTNYNTIFDACFRAHKLVIHVYQFLRLWILDHYHKQISIPTITKDTIKIAFKALSVDAPRGDQMNDENYDLYEQFKNFYETEYKVTN